MKVINQSQAVLIQLLLSSTLVSQTLAWTLPPSSSSSIGSGVDLQFGQALLDRRDFLWQSSSSSLLLTVANPAQPPRSVDVGNGFDLRQPPSLRAEDVLFPPSMEGLWTCQRAVIGVEGDAYMAETTWRALGGGGGKRKLTEQEHYTTRFLPLNENNNTYVVMDRAYEVASRTGSDNVVTENGPNQLVYDNKIKLSVLRRTIEVPSDQGFGYQEFVGIQDGSFVERAALVKRRYRRAYDADGNRVVEGLEIVKTFRVLDGVAGELPTSTTKSQIRLTRPI